MEVSLINNITFILPLLNTLNQSHFQQENKCKLEMLYISVWIQMGSKQPSRISWNHQDRN